MTYDDSTMDAALTELIDALRRGGEFPDVAPRIARRYQIDLEDLETAYDAA